MSCAYDTSTEGSNPYLECFHCGLQITALWAVREAGKEDLMQNATSRRGVND